MLLQGRREKGREDPSEERPFLKLGSTEPNAANQIPVSGLWAETFATRAVSWGHLELTLDLQVLYRYRTVPVLNMCSQYYSTEDFYGYNIGHPKTVVISPLLPHNLITTRSAISYMVSIKSTFNEHGAGTE